MGARPRQHTGMAGSSPGRRAKQNVIDPCPQGDRAQAYCELEHVLWEGDSRPPCGVVNRLLAEVSQDLTAAQVRGRSQRQREPPARAGALLADSSGLALPREGLRQSPVPRGTSESFSGRARQHEDGCQQCPGGSGPDTLHLGDGRAPGPPEGRGQSPGSEGGGAAALNPPAQRRSRIEGRDPFRRLRALYRSW